jgi:hypothetical protein
MHRIDINLQQSTSFKILLSLITLFSVIIACSLLLSLFCKLFLSSITICYVVYIFYTVTLLQGQHIVTELSFNQEGWQIRSQKNKLRVELSGDSTVTNWISILRFKTSNKQKYVAVIFRDMLSADAYRRLIVLLRTTRAYQAERMRKHPQPS